MWPHCTLTVPSLPLVVPCGLRQVIQKTSSKITATIDESKTSPPFDWLQELARTLGVPVSYMEVEGFVSSSGRRRLAVSGAFDFSISVPVATLQARRSSP